MKTGLQPGGRHAASDADPRHDDLGPADGGLIDHDGDPAARVSAEREADEQRGHLRAVEGGIAQQAVEPLGPDLLGLVERQGAGEGAEREPPLPAARAAPELQHRHRQPREAQRQPPPEIRGRHAHQLEHALDRRRLLALERPAGAARARRVDRGVADASRAMARASVVSSVRMVRPARQHVWAAVPHTKGTRYRSVSGSLSRMSSRLMLEISSSTARAWW